MKVYITKHALTKGIIEAEATYLNDTLISVDLVFYEKPDWHETIGDAIVHLEKIKRDKIAALKKKIAHIENTHTPVIYL